MKHAFVFAVLAFSAIGCATASADKTAARKADPRQGEEVNQICFTRNINGWQALGSRSLLLNKGVNDWYKLDLIGTCRPDWAFNAIALRTTGGSSCLSKFDAIKTFDDPVSMGSCQIQHIYKWNKDAGGDKATDPDASAAKMQ